MSERYPLISQLIQENRIPEFDALYLDMNGIIHNCSHPNDNDASFRITEEAIFLAVFAYVSHLFSVIKPKKLFFLAVDGVAPRAKMNQQRSRRFKTAKEMKELVDKAKRKGEVIPEGEGFDSNCITPGTPFMARLNAQLKYFIAKKVSEDADWRGVEIVLSGHDVPGEGEHKIMECIRLKKAQPGYDANVRHCLYGLDADLIMLGLLSHDPHFCLLREEVTFGPKGGKGKAKGLETQNFFLMHLSLFREYLDLEFSSLKTATPPLPFKYDLERIIDDFILLNIFVGNDFLPHLPGLHINEGALGRLFEIYKKILPVAGGYLNEHGILNVQRLQLVLNELTVFETEHFEHLFAEENWFKGKQTKHIDAMEKARARNRLVLTQEQRKLFTLVQSFVVENLKNLSPNARLEIPNTLPARDKRFVSDLANELRLNVTYDEYNAAGTNIVVLSFDETMLNLAREDQDESEGESNEAQDAILRVVKKYETAETAKEFDEKDWENEHTKQIEDKMTAWKRDYYREKLEFEYTDAKAVHDLAYRYIEGLQWVLHYYYSGVASWSWFYNYHYAPKISDLQNASTYKFNFELGHPFHPFEQLMGVLPDLSSAHIPVAFRDLLSDPTSPIIDFYPVEFELDLNGKKQDWEAIVKIPFIDEKRLLAAMATRAPRLSAEERARNEFGDSCRFTSAEDEYLYPSSLPGFFPDLLHCRCKVEPFDLPTLEGGLKYVKGLVPGVLLGKDAISGFPSLHTHPFTGNLGFHGVSVFQSDSRKETMVVTLSDDPVLESLSSEQIAELVVGKKTFTGYPYLQEGIVTAISDELFKYTVDARGRAEKTPHSGPTLLAWKRSADRIEHQYSKKLGCIIGNVDIVLHARLLKGLKRLDDGSTQKEFEDREQEFALQATVQNVTSEDVRFMEQPPTPIEEEYPEGDKVFFLGSVAYGVPAQVTGHEGESLSIRIAFFPNDKVENFAFKSQIGSATKTTYLPAYNVCRIVGISALTLSKMTSSMMVSMGEQKTNIGLNLKFEAKQQKVLGYTERGVSGWEFSQKAIDLLREYTQKFPEVSSTFERKRGGDLTTATDFFEPAVANDRMKQLKAWIAEKGVRDFEKVPLYSEQLEKESVMALEKLADSLVAKKVMANLKVVAIKNIPRQALLKPAHTLARLRDQKFTLGDRVITVADTGSVPLSAKGVVVGIQVGFIDVVFDVQFIGGSTLGDRCSAYRGMTVAPTSVLNLTQPQFTTGTQPTPPPSAPSVRGGRGNSNALFRQGPRGGAGILPAHGLPAAGFHPAPASASRGRGAANGGVQVLRNPTRPFEGQYGAVTRNELPAFAAPTLNHQQQLGAALGIPTGPSRGGGHHPHAAHPARGGGGIPPVFTAAQRGAPGAIRGAVPVGRGVGVPPPVHLMQPGRGGRGGGGRGRGAPRGARGAHNEQHQASPLLATVDPDVAAALWPAAAQQRVDAEHLVPRSAALDPALALNSGEPLPRALDA
ncbi:hypothetical protein RQP46_004459 [Phenoliferia psychrophenolica]